MIISPSFVHGIFLLFQGKTHPLAVTRVRLSPPRMKSDGNAPDPCMTDCPSFYRAFDQTNANLPPPCRFSLLQHARAAPLEACVLVVAPTGGDCHPKKHLDSFHPVQLIRRLSPVPCGTNDHGGFVRHRWIYLSGIWLFPRQE